MSAESEAARLQRLDDLSREQILTQEESLELEMLIAKRDGTRLSWGVQRELTRLGWRKTRVDGDWTWRKTADA